MGRDTFASASARLQSNVVKALTGYYRLKDFIHTVRGCKTLAEERTLVVRESAAIRTSFKEDISVDQQYHAVAKLLFIHMMGYPAHFGQVESLKMVASPRIMEKRLGYLGSTLLLDEQQPTLTLITNSIKHDLNDSNQSVVALALSNLAATASADISRDLAGEIERLIQSPSPYLRKKAAFCAARMIYKVPELADMFEERIHVLLNDRNHGVVLGGIAIVTEIFRASAGRLPDRIRRNLVPTLVKQLQTVLMGGNAGEYDVAGTCDPFLQVRILKLLRLLGRGDVAASEAMADILTQIATSTDPSRNVGHSILYETAVTIMNIESDSALRTMAINILGRLLSSNSSDSNLRYVALNLLNRIISSGTEGLSTVQRHRATILECLHESDLSIRIRAADLSLALITRETMRGIAHELLEVLITFKGAECFDFKQSLITKLSVAAAQHAPSAKWYVDTMKVILSQIDDASTTSQGVAISNKEEIVSTFVRIINNSAELHRYATEELWRAAVLREPICDEHPPPTSSDLTDTPQFPVSQALIQSCAWTIGEFADILLSARLASEEQLVSVLANWASPRQSPSITTVGYVIMSLGKLANRLPGRWSGVIVSSLERIANDYVTTHDVHYRACEMRAIVNDQTLRAVLLARIPPDASGDQLGRVTLASKFLASPPPSSSASHRQDAGSVRTASLVESPRAKPALDVFAELAKLSLDGTATPPLLSPSQRCNPAYTADGVSVYFGTMPSTASNEADGSRLQVEIRNERAASIEDVLLLIAVPKSMKVRLDPADAARAEPGGRVRQTMSVYVHDPDKGLVPAPLERIKLRAKLAFRRSASTDPESHQFDVTRLA